MKETISINKSLSNLGIIMTALAKKEFVNYRNSKLTLLLKDCLGVDSKALLLIAVDPSARSHAQTLTSLQFGAKVKNINLKDGATDNTQRSKPRSQVGNSNVQGSQYRG